MIFKVVLRKHVLLSVLEAKKTPQSRPIQKAELV